MAIIYLTKQAENRPVVSREEQLLELWGFCGVDGQERRKERCRPSRPRMTSLGIYIEVASRHWLSWLCRLDSCKKGTVAKASGHRTISLSADKLLANNTLRIIVSSRLDKFCLYFLLFGGFFFFKHLDSSLWLGTFPGWFSLELLLKRTFVNVHYLYQEFPNTTLNQRLAIDAARRAVNEEAERLWPTATTRNHVPKQEEFKAFWMIRHTRLHLISFFCFFKIEL